MTEYRTFGQLCADKFAVEEYLKRKKSDKSDEIACLREKREELIEKMAKAWWECEYDDPLKWENITEWSKENVRRHCRTALAVAEPVIREECAKIADITPYAFDAEKDMNTIAAAIREGGKDE